MRRINQCHNKQLLSICQKAMQIDDLNRKVIPFLPENIRPNWRVESFSKGCLTLVTSKAALATELRYLIPSLRDALRTNGGLYQLVSIKIQINTSDYTISAPVSEPEKIKSKLSLSARKTLQDAAVGCNDPALKAILSRMGSWD